MNIIKTLALSTLLAVGSITTVSAAVVYGSNLDDELESYKTTTIRISNDKEDYEDEAKISIMNMAASGKSLPKKYVSIYNPDNNLIIGACFKYVDTCTLMFKFDDRVAKPYEFTANVKNDIYFLETRDTESFLRELKRAKIVKTKIHNMVLTFDVSKVDYNKLEF